MPPVTTVQEQAAVSQSAKNPDFVQKFLVAAQFQQFLAMNESALKRLKKEQKTGFRNAKQYSQVVIGVGYVGLFAVWHQTRAVLATADQIWTGLFLTISVIAYAVQDVLNVAALVLNQIWLALAVWSKKQEFAIAEIAYQRRLASLVPFMFGAWLVFFPIAVIAALVAAKTLLLGFIYQLIRQH